MSAPAGIPAITLWQPWASLVAYGAKPYEFRSWAAPVRLWGERVAIHASARRVSVTEVRALLVKLHSAGWRDTGLLRDEAIDLLQRVKDAPQDVPLGSVMCLATLGTPIAGATLAAALGIDLVNDSDRGQHSNYGWPLTRVSRLRPFLPARGAQGWWRWHPSELVSTIDVGGAQ